MKAWPNLAELEREHDPMVLLKQNILTNIILRDYWSVAIPDLELKRGVGGGGYPFPRSATASKPNNFYVDHLTFVRLSSCYLFIY